MKTLQERLRKPWKWESQDIRNLLDEAATMLDEWQRIADVRLELCNEAIKQRDTLEAEVARLKQALAQAGDNIELQEAEQRGFLRGQATPLSAQEDVVERATKAVKNWCILHSAYIFTDEKARELAETIVTASGLLSTERERGLEEAALTRALLWSAFVELNAIRARDGAPKGVSEDYFRQLVDAISNELGDDCAPWPRDEWKPLLERSLKRSQEKG